MTLSARLVGDLLCVILCCISAGYDLRRRRIPNVLTLPALGVGLVLAYVGGGGYGLAGAAMAVALLGGLFAMFAAVGGIGWGDVKLMAAVGAFLGWPLPAWAIVLYALLYVALSGGILAVVVAAWQRRLVAALKATVSLPREEKKSSGVSIPYGVAICVGTLWAIASRYLPWLQLG